MHLDELQRRISSGEDLRTEFKSVARNRDRLLDANAAARTICAFANSGGGTLIIGVEDDRRVSGIGSVADADRLVQQLVGIASQAVRPPVTCRYDRVTLGGETVLVVEVPGFLPDRPHRAGTVYYVRDGTVTRDASRDELGRLFASSLDVYLDEQIVPNASREDLEEEAIRDFMTVAYAGVPTDQIDRYLRALRATSTDGRPTVTGVLLFARAPQDFLVDAHITAIRVRGTVMSGDFAASLQIGGRLPAQMDAADAFLEAHVPSPSHVEGTTRREAGIPRQALREAVANALAHRDYRVASQIRIFVFDDRVELINPGALLNELTLDGIRLGGISQRRNPHIAGALTRLWRRENAGVGVPEMIRWTVARGLPEPEFSLTNGQFRVVFRGPARLSP